MSSANTAHCIVKPVTFTRHPISFRHIQHQTITIRSAGIFSLERSQVWPFVLKKLNQIRTMTCSDPCAEQCVNIPLSRFLPGQNSGLFSPPHVLQCQNFQKGITQINQPLILVYGQ